MSVIRTEEMYHRIRFICVGEFDGNDHKQELHKRSIAIWLFLSMFDLS